MTVQDILDSERPIFPIEHGTLAKAPLAEDSGSQMRSGGIEIRCCFGR